MAEFTRIGFINTQGLNSKKSIILSTIKERDICILCMAETWLRPSAAMNLSGHLCYSRPRPILTAHNRPRGGVAIAVHQRLPSVAVDLPQALREYEIVATEVTFPTEGKVVIITAYFPPRTPLPVELFQFVASHPKAILCGDLNARHQELDDHASNPAGAQLRAHLNSLPNLYRIPTPLPTCHNSCGFSNPDHIIITTSLLGALAGPATVLDALHTGSDHDLLISEFHIPASGRGSRRILRKFGEEEKKAFTEALEGIPVIDPPRNSQELDEAAVNLVGCVQEAFLHSSKEINPPNNKPMLPKELRDVIAQARRIRKSIRKQRAKGYPTNPRLRTHLNHLKAKIKRGVVEARQRKWVQTIASLHPSQGRKFWTTLRCLAGQRKPTHPLQVNNSVLATPSDKATAFADTLQEIFRPNDAPEFNFHQQYATAESFNRRLLNSPLQESQPTDPVLGAVSDDEVSSTIQQKKSKSAPGRDEVSWKTLKNVPPNIITSISVLLTSILRLQHWPPNMKDGVFVMIPKPGKDPTDPKNWRPICLLPTISKILETILCERITRVMEQAKRLPSSQHGFRHNRGTVTALLRLIVTIKVAFQKKQTASALFLDINRAFDTIPHSLLLYKLHSVHHLPEQVIRLLQSFLCNRRCTVRVEASHSTPFTPHAGVPQGSPLSPLLYNLYCADLPVAQAPFKQEYADDTMYLVTSKNATTNCAKLQNSILPVLSTWLKRWRIAPNPAKTALVHFISPTQGLSQEDKQRGVRFWGQPIQPSLSAKYLGVILTHTLNFDMHFINMKKKARQREAVLKILRGPKFRAKPNILSNIYKALVRPLLTYAVPALGQLSERLMNDVIIPGDRRLLRLAAGLPWDFPSAFVYERTKCDDFPTTVDEHKFRLIKKLIHSAEDFIPDILKHSRRRRRRRPEPHMHPVTSLLQLLQERQPDFALPQAFRQLLQR